MGLRQTISEWVRIIGDALDFGPEFPAAMEARRVLFAQESARLQHLLEQTRKASQEKDELIARLRTAGAVTGNMIVDGPAYYIRRANALDGPFCTSCFQRNHEIMRIAPAPKPTGADETPPDWVRCTRCQTPFRSDRISQYLNPGKGTGMDDKRQKTEDARQRTEPQAHPSSVLRPPPSAGEPDPNPPQSRTDSMERGSGPQVQNPALASPSPTQNSALGAPSPDAMPRTGSRKPASAQSAVPPQEEDAPKPVKTARKPRTRTRKPKDKRPEPAKTTDRSKPTH